MARRATACIPNQIPVVDGKPWREIKDGHSVAQAHTKIHLVMSGLWGAWCSSAWELKPMSLLPEVWELRPTLKVERSRTCAMPGSSGRELAEDVEDPLLLPLV